MTSYLIRNLFEKLLLSIFRKAGSGEEEMITTHPSNGLMIPPTFYFSQRKIVLPIGMVAMWKMSKMESIVCGVFIIEMEIIVPRGDLLTHMNQV